MEAPTIKYPPKANKISVLKSTVSTLNERRILVISLKSEIIVLGDNEDLVMLNLLFRYVFIFESAKILY